MVRNLVARRALVTLIVAGMLAAQGQVLAGQPIPYGPPAAGAPLAEVVLLPGGAMSGTTVNADGRALQDVPVLLVQQGQVVASVRSDPTGQFTLIGVPEGIYEVVAGDGHQWVRLWAQPTAPPVAQQRLMVVANGGAVRGQFRPTNTYEWFEIKPLVGYTVLAAVIVVPIVLIGQSED